MWTKETAKRQNHLKAQQNNKNTTKMATRSLKSGADVKRNEAVSLNVENTPLHETPSQIQHKTKSTVVKIALLTTLCLENLVVFGAISVLAPFFSTEVGICRR